MTYNAKFRAAPLSLAHREALQLVIKAHGVQTLAERTDVCGTTIARAVAGLPVYRSTARALLAALDAPRVRGAQ